MCRLCVMNIRIETVSIIWVRRLQSMRATLGPFHFYLFIFVTFFTPYIVIETLKISQQNAHTLTH